MNLSDILKKAAAGEALTQEEKDFAAAYKPDGIPKSRLDAEIAKRKEYEDKATALETKLEELSGQVEDLQGKGLSEVEKVKKEMEKELNKLKQQNQTLISEKELTTGELATIKRKASISDLSAKFNFTDPEFLDFKASSSKLDLADEAKVKEFMDGLKTASPKMFKVDAASGGGSNPGGGDKGNVDYNKAKEQGNIAAMIAASPEIK